VRLDTSNEAQHGQSNDDDECPKENGAVCLVCFIHGVTMMTATDRMKNEQATPNMTKLATVTSVSVCILSF
jgi:hypothetical protein